jgi:acetyl esterase
MALDPQIAMLLEQVNALPPMSQGTVDAAREAFRNMSAMAASLAPPAEVESAEDITVPGAEGDLTAGLYRPKQAAGSASPTIVFFHGGGFAIGDIASYDGQCRILCSEVGATVLSVEYRLAPEHVFPAAAEDAIAVARWALENVARLGGDAERTALGGDSAGGNLAAVAAQATRASEPGYAAQLLLYPVTDLSNSDRPSHRENAEGLFLTEDDMTWFRGLYAGEGPFDDPRLSPLLSEDLSGLPPALLITAELDPLRDDGEAYGDALAAAGVEVIRRRYDGLIHGFFAMGAISNAAGSAVDEICADLRKLLT